jgi:hypothetical protein
MQITFALVLLSTTALGYEFDDCAIIGITLTTHCIIILQLNIRTLKERTINLFYPQSHFKTTFIHSYESY